MNNLKKVESICLLRLLSDAGQMRLVGTLQRGNDADGLSMIVYYSVDDFKSCFQEEGEAAKMAEEVAKKKTSDKEK